MSDLIAPTPDEWEAWRDHPVTRFVSAGLVKHAALAKSAWQENAWHGVMDPLARERAKTRAEVMTHLAELTLEDARGANGMEPKEPQ